MRLLAGLGNPGEKYALTRHNVGFRVLDTLARQEQLAWQPSAQAKAQVASWACGGEAVCLVKPMHFMNHSGESLAPIARYFKVLPEDITVVFDDLDLAKGTLRLRTGGGHGGHNGLKSIHTHLGSSDYQRVKFGIGRPESGSPSDWVLGKMTKSEMEQEVHLTRLVLDQIDTILDHQLPAASNDIQRLLQKNTEA